MKNCQREHIRVIMTLYIREYGKKNEAGTFHDVRQHLGRIRKQGVDALLILPVHAVGTPLWGTAACPYEPLDYYSIDPALVKSGWSAGGDILLREYREFVRDTSTEAYAAFRKFRCREFVGRYCRFRAQREMDRKARVESGQKESRSQLQSMVRLFAFEQFKAHQAFREFVGHVHENGMALLMDIPGYLGPDNVIAHADDALLQKNRDGSYYIPGTEQWGHGWHSLRSLDPEKRAATMYRCGAYRYWYRECNADGFRIDAVFTHPLSVVGTLRKQLPGAFLLGETIGTYRGNAEHDYLNRCGLDAIYSQEFINVRDIGRYLRKVHRRKTGGRLLHMHDTHDEGRLRDSDCYATSAFRYCGFLAVCILGLPGRDLIGFLDGNFDLLGGKPDLHNVKSKRAFRSRSRKLKMMDGTYSTPEHYISKLLRLRRMHPVFRRNGNILWGSSRKDDVTVFHRYTENATVTVCVNMGSRTFRGELSVGLRGGEKTEYRKFRGRDLFSGNMFTAEFNGKCFSDVTMYPGQVILFETCCTYCEM
jgi:hypothetical protein